MLENEAVAEIVAANIRARLRHRGLTITQLAELAGLSRVGLSRVLSGSEGITIERLAKLATVLEVPAWKLLKPAE